MGFSVSGSAAIIFAGLFIAFGMWHTAATNSFERVSDANSERLDRVIDTQNTEITIESAEWDDDAGDSGNGELTVKIKNAGGTQLTVNGTDLLVDNEYRSGWEVSATVSSDSSTDLWLTQETLTITVSQSTNPDQVKVVADTGIADTSGVDAV